MDNIQNVNKLSVMNKIIINWKAVITLTKNDKKKLFISQKEQILLKFLHIVERSEFNA